jgi:hypothetical protein
MLRFVRIDLIDDAITALVCLYASGEPNFIPSIPVVLSPRPEFMLPAPILRPPSIFSLRSISKNGFGSIYAHQRQHTAATSSKKKREKGWDLGC